MDCVVSKREKREDCRGREKHSRMDGLVGSDGVAVSAEETAGPALQRPEHARSGTGTGAGTGD